MVVQQQVPMRFKIRDVQNFSEGISLLLPRLDVVDLDDSLVNGAPHCVKLGVDVSRTPGPEPVGGHLDSPLVVVVNRDFVIHGRHH